MSDEYAQLLKIGLIIVVFMLVISDKSILFPNPGVGQRLVRGIKVGHLKGSGEVSAIYLGGPP